MCHTPGGRRVKRDRMGKGYSQPMAPGVSQAASTALREGWAVGAVAEVAAELLSELRASEHEGGSHTGVCEGRTPRRILSASPTSRVGEIA
jgi:hypothetical protein